MIMMMYSVHWYYIMHHIYIYISLLADGFVHSQFYYYAADWLVGDSWVVAKDFSLPCVYSYGGDLLP